VWLPHMQKNTITYQPSLFPNLTAKFPATRYQGSKAKLVDWIWEQIKDKNFSTCLDAFGGTGAVAYRLKQAGKQVTYNDILRFNYYFGQALIENNHTQLQPSDVSWLLQEHADLEYPRLIQDTFQNIYFTPEENRWIDRTITNIRQLTDPYKFALAFFALAQSCIVKRPYNLFHRKNLYIRFADVDRTFGNKTSWDKPFDIWFQKFIKDANRAIFDTGQTHTALNHNALNIPGKYDLVYIDTPYISQSGTGVDYRSFYHFLEGLTFYDTWEESIDETSKHRRLVPQHNEWTKKAEIHTAFERIFEKFQESIIVVSYRSDGIPSDEELIKLLKIYKPNVSAAYFGKYKYALSTNSNSKELLIIGE